MGPLSATYHTWDPLVSLYTPLLLCLHLAIALDLLSSPQPLTPPMQGSCVRAVADRRYCQAREPGPSPTAATVAQDIAAPCRQHRHEEAKDVRMQGRRCADTSLRFTGMELSLNLRKYSLLGANPSTMFRSQTLGWGGISYLIPVSPPNQILQ
jgi:hypothetical protein